MCGILYLTVDKLLQPYNEQGVRRIMAKASKAVQAGVMDRWSVCPGCGREHTWRVDELEVAGSLEIIGSLIIE
jgi:hypothetical protein